MFLHNKGNYSGVFTYTSPIKLVFLILLLASPRVCSQTVYHHISNRSVYLFLDEMALEGFIDINSPVLPFSREYIAVRLSEIDTVRDLLNVRQQKELDFFLKDFHKELKPDKYLPKRFDIFYYKDSLFTLSANLIAGMQYWTNTNGNVYHRWNGGEVFAYVGEHWGFYASLRDNHESMPVSDSPYLTNRTGGNYKGKNDYSEMRGGITYTWEWGTLGLIKDHNSWGSYYANPIIQSGRTPSFVKLHLNLRPIHWFEFNYFHGWLISEEVDSTRSYWTNNSYGSNYREVYHPKFMAANLFTFIPLKKLHISAGNSIIYTDLGLHPAYLIPVFFYKSVDHTLNAGINNQNSQMFLDISSRNIRHLHLYGTFFIDELALSRLNNKEKHSNFWAWKLGTKINTPIENLSLTMEYTRSNPLAFRHNVPTLTYESNKYNIGYYLTDNALDYYLSVSYKPLPRLIAELSMWWVRKGPDYTEQGTSRLGLRFMESVDWEEKAIHGYISYQLINDWYIFALYRWSNVTGDVDRYTPSIWHGKTGTWSAGMNFGF
jgi:hypothetical protein